MFPSLAVLVLALVPWSIEGFASDLFSAQPSAPWRARSDASAATLGGQIFFMAGADQVASFNDVWRFDGVTWTAAGVAPWAARSGARAISLGDTLFLVGGAQIETAIQPYNDVWSTKDGSNWTLVTQSAAFGARWDHEVFAMSGRLFLAGGRIWQSSIQDFTPANDVWSTQDGITWNLLTASASWTGRFMFNSFSLGNSVLVMAGANESTFMFNDIYSSIDGITWIAVTQSAAFGVRQAAAAARAGSRLWIAGGQQPAGLLALNDVWFSDDNGTNWAQATSTAIWPARAAASMPELRGSVYLIGGVYAASFNTVYALTDACCWSPIPSTPTPRPGDGDGDGDRGNSHSMPTLPVYAIVIIVIGGSLTIAVGVLLFIRWRFHSSELTTDSSRGGAASSLELNYNSA